MTIIDRALKVGYSDLTDGYKNENKRAVLGIGYEIIPAGSKIRKGDEFLSCRTWIRQPPHAIGDTIHSSFCIHRRKKKPKPAKQVKVKTKVERKKSEPKTIKVKVMEEETISFDKIIIEE